MTGTFRCCGCAACCNGLRHGATPHAFAEVAPGVYQLPTPGGLAVLTFELNEERAAGRVQALPRLAIASGDALHVLVWELAHDACPLLDDQDRCSVYDRRPLVCRSFPLLHAAGAAVVSSFCHTAVPLPDAAADRAAAYPTELPYAERAPEVMSALRDIISTLTAEGVLSPRAGLDEATAKALPARDLIDLAEAHGVATRADLRSRFHAAPSGASPNPS